MSMLSDRIAERKVDARTAATLPRINLLPPEILLQRRFRRTQKGLGVGVVAALAVVAGLYVLAMNDVTSASQDLDATKADSATLNTRAAQYSAVPRINAQVDAAQAQLSRAMGQEVRWSYFLNDLGLRIPPRVWVTEMAVTQDVDGLPAATSATTNPLDALPNKIGEVTFTGRAFGQDDVAAWLESLTHENGYALPYFTSAKEIKIGTRTAVEFSSSVKVTDGAISFRAKKLAGN